MATPTHETIQTYCNEKLFLRFDSQIVMIPSLFINNFCLMFSFRLRLLCSLCFCYKLCFFMITPCIFRSGAVSILMFTHVLQSYLAFETINVSSQKPCILRSLIFHRPIDIRHSPLLLLTLDIDMPVYRCILYVS